MQKPRSCPYCLGEDITRANTYKSYWYSCNDCGNVVREIKDKYFFEKIIPRALWGRISPERLAHPKTIRELIVYALYKNRDRSGYDMYDYYLDPKLGYKESPDNMKFAPETDELLEELKKFNVDMSGKTVLEISGGPGYVGKNIEKIAKKYIVTEFNHKAVERMRNVLGLNAYKFDLNSDNIGEIITDKVDIVLMRHCINFCYDINKFLRDLKPLLNDNPIIYVSTCLPTLGCFTRWCLDDYTFLVLQNPESISKIFAEEGFIRFGTLKQFEYHFLYSRVHRLHLYASPFTVPIYLWNRLKHVNTETLIKPRVMLYKKNSEPGYWK